MTQKSLFPAEIPTINEGDKVGSLWEVLVAKKNFQMRKPVFQRDFVWEKEKIAAWAQSIRKNKAIGVIVTYQIGGSGPVYLCDGLQRITATEMILDDPFRYGWKASRDEIESYVRAFNVSIQHRHYEDQTEAMEAFQNLNLGTALSPYEYFKGELTLSEPGAEIHNRAPEVMERIEHTIFASGKSAFDRQKQGRDALALFHRFAVRDTRQLYEGIGARTVKLNKVPVERLIRRHIESTRMTKSDAIDLLSRFETTMHEFYAETKECLPGLGKKTVSPTLWRFFAHLYLWVINQGYSHTQYKEFVKAVATLQENRNDFDSRFSIVIHGVEEPISLRLGGIRFADKLCEHFGIAWESKLRRKRTRKTPPGYAESHVLPFVEYGDGETFVEPAKTNRLRGAKPVTNSRSNASSST